MGTCGQPGYVFRDFCLEQGIEFIIFVLGPVYMEASQPGKRAGSLYRDLGSPYILCKKTH